MDKLRAVLNGRDGNPDSTPNVIQTVNEASTLSWTTRVRGFGVCMGIGILFSVLGVCCLFIPRIGIILFIVLYTFGNICSLASTMFLMGPVKQLKRMFDKTRAFATVVMLACLVLTLCAAFWWKIFILTFLFVILQVIAFAWYGLSYIPFARDAILKFFSTMCRMCIRCTKNST
ncbi:SFT2 domain containing 2a isoform X2 [Neoarius graeffei]|uniref:SFT2 domain containing 2a isoform X2 n=1 Tax=Neoarius graeffei TaxID=443677 RepID=UPI00298D08C1|nr:SFT2 domain containing 2a isoform X2 [Neoarius graeffei]